MQCPFCQSQSVVKNGKYSLRVGSEIQHHLCKACGKRFSEKTGTPMAGLRTSPEIVAMALKMRGEGMGVRASSRVLDKSHSTILRWEERMARQASQWSPPTTAGGEVIKIYQQSDNLMTEVLLRTSYGDDKLWIVGTRVYSSNAVKLSSNKQREEIPARGSSPGANAVRYYCQSIGARGW